MVTMSPSFVSDASDLESAQQPESEDILDRTRETLKARTRAGRGPELAKRPLGDSAAKTLTTKELAAFLRVSRLWVSAHGSDPEFLKPIRLGDPANPRSPLRWLESDAIAYLRKMQARTTLLRVGSGGDPNASTDNVDDGGE